MVAVVGWGTDTYGARNVYRGEYDTVQYYTVVLGFPVFFSFRGCVHVIDPAKVGPGRRLERLRQFARDYLRVRSLDWPISFPLQPVPRLRRLVLYDTALWILGAFTVLAVIATLAIAQQPDPLTVVNAAFLAVFWAGARVFVVGLAAYLATRAPSARQGQIRAIVAEELGPFSDPADWTREMVAAVAPTYNIERLDPDEMVEAAQSLLDGEEYENALIEARLALALIGVRRTGEAADRAEAITDECLRVLGDAPDLLP